MISLKWVILVSLLIATLFSGGTEEEFYDQDDNTDVLLQYFESEEYAGKYVLYSLKCVL